MKTTKFFLMAALALTFAACSNDDNDAVQPAKAEGITITATLAPKSDGAATRAVAEGTNKVTVTWAVDEHIAILYEVNSEKKVADATITAVDNTTGAATISFTVADGTPNDTPCTLVYPKSAAKDDNSGVKDAATLLAAQDGTLNANLDVRVGEGTIQTTTPGLTVTTQPAAQFAIFKFTTKNSGGSATIDVSALTVTIDGQAYVITPASATSTLYAALPEVSSQKVSFTATGSDNKTYVYSKDGVTFDEGKFYKSTLQMTEVVAVDLGLSVKWANMNVGAESVTDYGKYYAWGATTDNYSAGNGYHFANTPYYTGDDWTYSWSKYTSGGETLEAGDDAAHVNWGGSWRMPTHDELEELARTCPDYSGSEKIDGYSWEWQSDYQGSGHAGYLITVTKDCAQKSNSIFLPAAGYRYGSSLSSDGSLDIYWSSTLNSGGVSHGWVLQFRSGYAGMFYYYRYYGFTVRAVQ
jgi:uncharacterized protein (TIGR02145 family)